MYYSKRKRKNNKKELNSRTKDAYNCCAITYVSLESLKKVVAERYVFEVAALRPWMIPQEKKIETQN